VQANFWMGAAAATTLVLSAWYMLWLYQRVFFGEEPADLQKEIYDMQPREWGAMLPMVAVLLWLGTYSQSFMPAISLANASVLKHVNARVEMQVKQNEPAGTPALDIPVTPAAEVLGAR
jgi:NADH-quinone oxidoreductase subunit M